jgi:hypothetical protein
MGKWLKKTVVHPNQGMVLNNKKEQTLGHATTWVNHQTILFSEPIPVIICMIPFI